MYHSTSCECNSDALELFEVPPTVTTLQDGEWVEHFPVNNIEGNSPIQFEIKGQAEEYLDLSQTYHQVEVKVKTAQGVNLAQDAKLAPVNNFLHSMFSEIDVALNGHVITPGTDTYPYRAYLEKLLSFGKDTKNGQLKAYP